MNQKQSIRPHGVFVVEGEGDNAFWIKVGAAWPHEDRKGFNITLSAMPISGRLVIREPKAQESK
jgi:hypothetical protein